MTATSYSGGGLDPVYGLATDKVVDPAGLNLDTKTAYETPGTAGFLRPTASALPSASVTTAAQSSTTAYYGNSEARDIPCTGGATGVNQAGRAKTSTDPTGASGTPVVIETVYDAAGRVAATRVQADGSAWTCTSYDARGRVLSETIPAVHGAAARVVTHIYAVGGSPLVTSVSDAAGTVTTTTDLLGRTVSYTDAKGVVTTSAYDRAGRDVTDTTSSGGSSSTVTTGYLDDGRVSQVKLDGNVVAVPSYDTVGQLSSVSYPSGAGNAGNGSSLSTISRDPQGRETAIGWTLPGSHSLADAVSLSQADRVSTESSNVDAVTNAAWTYGYDNAGRLTSAGLAAAGARPAVAYAYGYTGSGVVARIRGRGRIRPAPAAASRSVPGLRRPPPRAPTSHRG